MQVIPVIDLMGRQVVRAKMGERAAYRPIETPLARTSDPVEVVAGLLRLAPFPTLYVADLDAIRGGGDNFAALARLRAAFPALQLWIDNGAADAGAVAAIRAYGTPVLGSESQRDPALVEATPDALLSLDFRGEALQGPGELLARPQLWPDRLIVMTLGRVGSGAGPDLDRLATIRALAGPRRLYAAGGVRDRADLAALERAGAAGVLVASALHDGRLTAADL
ncbi:MAG: nickel transporter [Pseudomonadota bacterium]|nr:nickel transporter [Pseudomonadota bacterium]